MGTKLKGFRLPIEIALKLEDLAKTEKYSSEAFIVSEALEDFFHSLERKEEEKPPVSTEDLEAQLTEVLKEIERLKDVLRKEIECFSRFEDEGQFYCAKNAPKVVVLPTLKICRACKFKMTKETLPKGIPHIHYYYACGATEKLDEKAGITWLLSKNPRCPIELRGKWHTIQQCNAKDCPLLKSYYTKKQ